MVTKHKAWHAYNLSPIDESKNISVNIIIHLLNMYTHMDFCICDESLEFT